jgi:dephospho-CoA kinase
MAKQMTDGERRSVADVVIENSGSLDDLRARLVGLWQTLVPR